LTESGKRKTKEKKNQTENKEQRKDVAKKQKRCEKWRRYRHGSTRINSSTGCLLSFILLFQFSLKIRSFGEKPTLWLSIDAFQSLIASD